MVSDHHDHGGDDVDGHVHGHCGNNYECGCGGHGHGHGYVHVHVHVHAPAHQYRP